MSWFTKPKPKPEPDVKPGTFRIAYQTDDRYNVEEYNDEYHTGHYDWHLATTVSRSAHGMVYMDAGYHLTEREAEEWIRVEIAARRTVEEKQQMEEYKRFRRTREVPPFRFPETETVEAPAPAAKPVRKRRK